jgi:hypothetical protein
MSAIPLQIQRRYEQRWALRFGSLIPDVSKSGSKGSPVNIARRLPPTHANVSPAMTASVRNSTEILRSSRHVIADNASSGLGVLTSSARPI